jgi:hypothetical protein
MVNIFTKKLGDDATDESKTAETAGSAFLNRALNGMKELNNTAVTVPPVVRPPVMSSAAEAKSILDRRASDLSPNAKDFPVIQAVGQTPQIDAASSRHNIFLDRIAPPTTEPGSNLLTARPGIVIAHDSAAEEAAASAATSERAKAAEQNQQAATTQSFYDMAARRRPPVPGTEPLIVPSLDPSKTSALGTDLRTPSEQAAALNAENMRRRNLNRSY